MTDAAEDAIRLLADSYISPCVLAPVCAVLGRLDNALCLLENAYEVRAAELVWLGVRPVFDSFRGIDRFERILHGIGLTH